MNVDFASVSLLKTKVLKLVLNKYMYTFELSLMKYTFKMRINYYHVRYDIIYIIF